MSQPVSLSIDFVSDVSCPWCAIGLSALELALQRVGEVATATITCRPFELNPQMPPGGQDVTEHLTQKYGSTPEQQAQIRETIRQRGADVGFVFRPEGRGRIYNTFDAHRLLHWAAEQGDDRQLALKKALLRAYFTEGQPPESHAVLVAAAVSVGLDGPQAHAVLASGAWAAEVRADALVWRQAGIQSVPATIVNRRHLISGGQPVEAFEQALRQIAANMQAA